MSRDSLAKFMILVVFLPGAAGAESIPDPPDLALVAALVERPTGDCNAADFFMAAEKTYSAAPSRPGADRRSLPPDHPALALILKGLECRSCVFPYSLEMTLPPTDQQIPMMAVYMAAAGSFVDKGQALAAEKEFTAARAEYSRAVLLGLMLYEEPGITFIQDMVALNVIARGLESIGDLAIARGDEEEAAACARFLARSRAYLDGTTRFIKQDLPYAGLLEKPSPALDAARRVPAAYDATTNLAARVEILMFLSFARVLTADAAFQESARAVLERAAADPDARIRKLAVWGRDLDVAEARRQVGIMVGAPVP